MSGNRRHDLERICQAALDRAPQARSAFLAEACAGDDALRQEVESLLAHEPAADDFMEALVRNAAAEGGAERDAVIGQSIGPYQVVSWLGAGGMGEVYRARTRGSVATWRSKSCQTRSRRIPAGSPAVSSRSQAPGGVESSEHRRHLRHRGIRWRQRPGTRAGRGVDAGRSLCAPSTA